MCNLANTWYPPPVWPQPPVQHIPQTPHKCPVCEGKGTVPEGFYAEDDDRPFFPFPENTCRTCWSSGIVWEPGVVTVTNTGSGTTAP